MKHGLFPLWKGVKRHKKMSQTAETLATHKIGDNCKGTYVVHLLLPSICSSNNIIFSALHNKQE